MSRPLRIEYPGALFHLTTRGNNKQRTFFDDADRILFLDLLAEAVDRFAWLIPAYVLMSNHYHMLVELTKESLAKGLAWLNGEYARAFNKRYDRVGHLFQARPHEEMVEKEVYFLNALRYDVLNPVRAKMVAHPADYAWCSYRATAGLEPAPPWLAADDVLRRFAPRRETAQLLYRVFVQEGIGKDDDLWSHLVGGIYLGSEAWMECIREKVESKPRDSEHPASQRRLRPWNITDVISSVAIGLGIHTALVRNARGGVGRMLAAWIACYDALLTLSTTAAGLRIRSSSHVSRLIRRCNEQLKIDEALQRDLSRCRAVLYET